jgi:hypothetical protein
MLILPPLRDLYIIHKPFLLWLVKVMKKDYRDLNYV